MKLTQSALHKHDREPQRKAKVLGMKSGRVTSACGKDMSSV